MKRKFKNFFWNLFTTLYIFILNKNNKNLTVNPIGEIKSLEATRKHALINY